MPKYLPNNLNNLDPKSESFKSALISNLENIGESINNLANENIRSGASISWQKIDFNNSPFVRNDYIKIGLGDPENVLIAPIGSIYLRTDGGAGTTFYVKESGTGNTGWVAK